MATTSDVFAAVTEMSANIKRQRALAENAKASITAALNTIASLPAAYDAELAQVNAWSNGTPDTFQGTLIDGVAGLQAEITGLVADLQAAQTSLDAIDFGG